jgi:hypothetical protein
MVADSEITRYPGEGRPQKRADAWRQLATLVGAWYAREGARAALAYARE